MEPKDEQVVLAGIPQSRGGKARAAALSGPERKDIARRAAMSRWHGSIPSATHEGLLNLGDLALQCAVVEGQRLISEASALRVFGIRPSNNLFESASIGDQSARLPMFVGHITVRPFIDNELMNLLTSPIPYRQKRGGKPVRGLDATLIPRVCDVWLRARDAGVLKKNQLGIAARADGLVRALAKTGIVALVDEATGYQEVRDRLALQAILDAYLSHELAAWAKRFPNEFYQEIFRLRGWAWDELRKMAGKGQGPRVVGKYTNDLVYARLAPGILEELQQRNPITGTGKRQAKHHQWLTEDVGNAALAQHLHAVIGLMRAAESWEQFMAFINRAFPRRTDLKDLPLFTQKAVGSIGPAGQSDDGATRRTKAS